jgi:hypothetical protein
MIGSLDCHVATDPFEIAAARPRDDGDHQAVAGGAHVSFVQKNKGPRTAAYFSLDRLHRYVASEPMVALETQHRPCACALELTTETLV